MSETTRRTPVQRAADQLRKSAGQLEQRIKRRRKTLEDKLRPLKEEHAALIARANELDPPSDETAAETPAPLSDAAGEDEVTPSEETGEEPA